MEFRVYTFVETRRNPATDEPVDVDRTFSNLLEHVELADRVGLDVFDVTGPITPCPRRLGCADEACPPRQRRDDAAPRARPP